MMYSLLISIQLVCSIIGIYSETAGSGHLVLITSPFFGHMIPLLDLAMRLSEYHHVSYVVSSSKLNKLKEYASFDENTNSPINSRLKFIGLNDGNDDDYQVINSVANIPIRTILQRMHEPLRKLIFPEFVTSTPLIKNRPIDMIITDLFVLPPVWEAYQRSIPTYIFIPNSLLSFIRYINITLEKINRGQLGSDFDRYINRTISLANGLIFNSVFELDERILNVLRQQFLPGSSMPILFVAPLISDNFDQSRHRSDIVHIEEWLDTHWKLANRSPCVIYVAFGSWVFIEPKQLIEIINSLKPYTFIWSLKAKFQTSISSLEIDSKRHLLLDWAPQRFILSHPAVRLFISHGGWNSLLESMSAGKPALVWPIFADQMANGYRLEYEFGMGQCIKTTSMESGEKVISTEEITLYLKNMFSREKEYLQKAEQVKKIILNAKENSSRVYFEKIIKTIDKQLRTKNTEKHREL